MNTQPRAGQSNTWIVVAAYQEATTVATVVEALRELGWQVVVVDDGSRDTTGQEARSAGAVVLRHVVNLGQGAALRTGIQYAVRRGAHYIVTFDADGQHRPQDIPALLAALDEGNDVALGSRFLGGTRGASRWRRAFLRATVAVSNQMSGIRLSDAHCGLRAFTAHAATRIEPRQNGMSHASEILYQVRRHRLRYREVPVTIHYSAYSKAKGQSPLNAVRVVFDFVVHRAQPSG